MNQQIITLLEFFDFIDPSKSIDREQTVAELTTVSLLITIDATKNLLQEPFREALNRELRNIKSLSLETVTTIYQDANKTDLFLENSSKNIVSTRREYISVMSQQLSENELAKLNEKLPIMVDN